MRSSCHSAFRATTQRTAFLAGAFALFSIFAPHAVHASVTIFGPAPYTIPANQDLTFSETVTVPPGPCASDSAVYTLVITNGNADGTGKLANGSIVLNGLSILTDEISRGLATIEKPVVLNATNTLAMRFSAGTSNGVATVTLRRQMTTPVFAQKKYTLSSADGSSFQEDFSVAQPGVTLPYTLILTNGVGSDLPADDVSITINGTQIISKKDIDSRGNNNAGQVLLRTVVLQAQNTLRIDLKNNKLPASIAVRIVRPVADSAGPDIAIAGVDNNSVVSSAMLTVTGTVTDSAAVASLRINAVAVAVATDGTFRKDVDLTPGPNTIKFDAADCEGNVTHKEIVVLRDVSAPLIAITAPLDRAILGTSSVTVSGTASDDIGIASVTVNGQPATLTASGWTAAVTLADGPRPITAVATDRSGKQTAATISVVIDTTLPTITATVAPAPNAAGWNRSDVMVTFECNDSGSGIATCTAPFVVSAESNAQTVTGTAVDKAGNTKSVTAIVKLDKTAPVVTAVTTPAPNGAGWNNTDVNVRFDAVDARSGVASVTPASVVSAEGAAQQVSGSATDVAGNASPSVAATLNIDKSGPVISITSPVPGTTLSSTAQTIIGTIADTLSGPASVRCGTVAATISAGTFTCSVTFVEGANTLAIEATDVAGNIATQSAQYTVVTDVRPPSIAITTPVTGSFSNLTTVDVTGTASDDKAVASVTVNGQPATFDGTNWTATVTFAPDSDGVKQITAVATDTSAKQTTATASITLDTTPPTIVSTVTPLPNAAGWNTTSPTVSFQCSDATSGIDTCSAPETITEDGQRPVRGVAVDKAGNVTAINVPVSVDTTRPVIQAVPSPDPSSDGWFFASTVTVGFQCNDALSGMVSCSDPVVFTNEGSGQVATGVAVDAAGNRSTTTFTVNSDRTAPTLTVTPLADIVSTPQVTLMGTVGDAPSGLKIVLCGSSPATVTGSSFTCVNEIREGPNSILVVAADLAGNETRTVVHVLRDTLAPMLTVDYPAAGQITNAATITIKGRAVDVGGLASLKTASGQTVAVTDNVYSLDVPLTEGANSVELIATDLAGNISRATATATRFTVPAVTIDSPADLALVRSVSVPVRGTVSSSVTSVLVNGIPATITGSTFLATDVPLSQGRTVITASASAATGALATTSVNIYHDSIPPRLDVYSPRDGATVYAPTVSISGMVDDIVVGTINAGQVAVSVNGIQAEVANRAFLLPNVPLAPGLNTLVITATDQGGNSTVFSYHINYATPPATAHLEAVSGNAQRAAIGATLAQPVVVRVVDGSGTPMSNRAVTFNVLENDGQLSNGTNSGRSLDVATDAQGQASVRWALGTRAGAGNNRIEARGNGLGVIEFDAVATTGQPHLIVVDSGNDQFAVIGAALPRPLVAVVVDEGSNRLANVPVTFTVTRGGGNFNGQPSITVQTDSDGRAIVSPILGPLPGQDNHRFSASIAGVATTANFHASGRTAGPASATKISGVILDNSSTPIPGVSVRIEGTSLMTQSDGQGQFVISPAPVGYDKLIIDGSTAQRPGTWPMLEFSMFALPGNDNTIGMPVYLLPVDMQRGLNVNETTGGTLTLPELPGFSLTIAPGSVTFPGGSRTGTVSVTLVHADKMPMTPGFGQQPRFLVTIQPPGAHFDPPAPISFPNVDGLAPGSVTEMYSFDHDLGQFVAIGTGSVSADGTVLRTDPGVGIIKGGWHCGGNPAQPGTSASCPECQTCDGENCVPGHDGSTCGVNDGCFVSSLCQNGNCVQTPLVCKECRKCDKGNCVADPLQDAKVCTNPDKCTVNPHCETGVCMTEAIDLEKWTDDLSTGPEVKLPDSVLEGINGLFSRVPGFEAGKLSELSLGSSSKKKDCCDPEKGRITGGITETSSKLTLTAKFPIPVGWVFVAVVETGIASVAVAGEAVFEATPAVSVSGEKGTRDDKCKNENCAFGKIEAAGSIDLQLKLKATACGSVLASGPRCLSDITIVPAGVRTEYAIAAHYNDEACGSGITETVSLDKIVVHAEIGFNIFGFEFKKQWEYEFSEAYKATF